MQYIEDADQERKIDTGFNFGAFKIDKLPSYFDLQRNETVQPDFEDVLSFKAVVVGREGTE